MRYGDTQIGAPEIIYKDTKANIESLTVVEGAIAYATDTNEFGSYNGAAWVWGQGNFSLGVYDDSSFIASGTRLSFDRNLNVGVTGSMIYISAPVTTYQRFGQPIPLAGVTGTVWRVPDQVYASGSLGVFYNGIMQTKGLHYEELIYVSGTYNLLFIPATGTNHMVSYGVPCVSQTYLTGTAGSAFALSDSDSQLLLDSDSNQLLDSDG